MGSLKLIAPWGEIHPEELNELGFKSTFGKRPSQVLLSFDQLTLVGEDREQIYQSIYFGQGRFEGIPIQCISDSGVQSQYYLSMRGLVFTDNSVKVRCIPRKGNLHFFEKADNLSWEVIKNEGFLPESMSVKVPYLIVKDDLVINSIILAVTSYSMIMEIARTIKSIGDLAGDALDVLGTGVLATIAKAIVLAVYLATLIIALINLINQLVQLFFPKLRNLRATSDYVLIRQACEYLGYTLDSELLLSLQNQHTLPIPIINEIRPSIFEFLPDELGDGFNYWYPTVSDTVPTPGALIAEIEKQYNAETVVYDGVVKIETRSYFMANAMTSVPNVLNKQDTREMEWTYNDDEAWKRKILRWTIDYADKHTADNFYKNATELDTRPVTVVNPDLVEITNYHEETFSFALGQRKNKLNRVEETVRIIFKIADSIVDIFAPNPGFENKILDRKGCLIISDQNYSVTKKLWLNVSGGVGKQPIDFIDYLSPSYIYDTYHKDYEVKTNSKMVVVGSPVPMTDYKYHLFAKNKYIVLEDTGEVVELLSADWKDRQSECIIDYQKFDNSGFNTETVKIY